MSVDYIETYELMDAVSKYTAALTRYNAHNTSRGPSPEKLALALVTVHHANVMALDLAYGDTNPGSLLNDSIKHDLDPDTIKATYGIGVVAMRQWVRQMRRFVENTKTNAGTDCLPDPHASVIAWAIRCVLDGLAGMYLPQ